MKTIKTTEEFNQAVASDKPSIIVFSTAWCPDCLYLKPKLPDLEKANADFDWYIADRDELIDLAQELDILGIPSLLAYKDGKQIGSFVSTLCKTPQQIQDWINGVKEN